MSSIYMYIGEKVWDIIGEIPGKVKGVLESRFKTIKTKKPTEKTEVV